MPIPDEERQFEAQLRRFVPREVAPLPAAGPAPFRWRLPVGVAAALALIASFLWYAHTTPEPTVPRHSSISASRVTLGRAHAELNQAPSFEAAIDELERASKPQRDPQLNQSALEVLGRETM
jgi:hypothetical protein